MTIEIEDTSTEEITLEQVTELLDKKYYLIYVDYRDNLDDSLDNIQAAIQSQEWYKMDECIDEYWEMESRDSGVDYILKDNLPGEMVRAFDIEKEKAEEWIDDHRDELQSIIWDRDESTPLDDLLRNTSDPVCFYDTGVYIEENWYDAQAQKEAYRTIKKTLGIKIRDKKYDKIIWSILANASYGGRLVVYFRMPIKDMMDIGENNIVQFSDPIVAVIDTGNGSGDHDHFPGLKVKFPLDTTNIFLDKTVHYSYVYEVCGLIGSFADVTNVEFLKNTRSRKKSNRSSLHDEMDLQKKYDEIFKAGGCTSGDMDIKRHRNLYYENNFPCGTHCPHCHTFWID